MKLTKRQLRQIIKEEFESALLAGRQGLDLKADETEKQFDPSAQITLPVSGGGAAYRPGRARREFIMTREPYEYGAELIKKPSNHPQVKQAYELFDKFKSERPGSDFSGLNPDDYYLYFKDELST